MFEDCGSKIRPVAIVFFWITVIVSVIAAFVVGMEDYPIIFFVFLIGIPFLSCISTVFLVAIGDLFENVYNTRYDIRDIKKTIEKMSKEESK